MKRADKPQHLVDTAATLFNRCGYHATGVDQVINAAGVAKTTLYRHFNTKDELIVAVLESISENFRRDMRSFLEQRATDAKQRLVLIFDYLENWFRQPDFNGCPFMNAAGEYSDQRNAVFHAAVLHKRLMVAFFEELARAADIERPEEVSEQINLLHEGAISVAQMTGDSSAAQQAGRIVQQLVDRSTTSGYGV